MNETEFDLVRELRRRAEEVQIAPGLDSRARQRALRVWRRRWIAGTAAAAAALAVMVPTALSLPGLNPALPQPADAPGTGPSQNAANDGLGETTLSIADLEQGELPGIGWVERRVFHRTDGVDVFLPPGLVEPVAIAGGAVGRNRDLLRSPLVFSSRERVRGGGPAVSADGSLVAQGLYKGGVSTLVVAPTSEPQSADNSLVDEIPGERRVSPVGFLGPQDVVSNVLGKKGIAVAVRRDRFDGSPTSPWNVTAIRAVSEAAQLVVGRVPQSGIGSCWEVLPADGGQPLWQTCRYAPDHFSPDGSVLAGTSYLLGTGDRIVVALDAHTGRVLHVFEPSRDGEIVDVAFEDDAHLLLVVSQSGQSAIVRCDLEGSCDRATESIRNIGTESPYGFGRQP
ncbi:MAG: hypothetical protein ACRDOY_02850 [Nocardioidaceae bacterium]